MLLAQSAAITLATPMARLDDSPSPGADQARRGDRRPTPAGQAVPDLRPRLDAIKVAGLRLECEVLTTGEVSLTITDPEEGDFDSEVVANGPGVPSAIDRLIRRFDVEVYSKLAAEAAGGNRECHS